MSKKLNSAQTIVDEVFTPFLATLDARHEDTLRGIVAELRGAVIDGFQAYGDANDRLVDRVVPRLELEAESARAELVEERNSFLKFRDVLTNIGQGVKIETDHAHFASCDDAQEFLDVVSEMDGRHLENEINEGEPPRDWIAELRTANTRLALAEATVAPLVRDSNQTRQDYHDLSRRNTDLQEANSRYLERARGARNVLRKLSEVLHRCGGELSYLAPEIDEELNKRISS